MKKNAIESWSQNWKQIKAVAMDAWARPAAERVACVTSACADDEALRREVLSLVASMEAAEDRFETPPPLPADDIPMPATLNGRRVGPYEILSRIGAGGMGEVYKARDTRLGRSVAIKVLPVRATADPVSRERMEREARAVAALNHPHICAIYDIGSHDGVDYFVMELVNGESLATRLSRGELPVAEALRYAEQIASALGEAHRAGIVHRDVKPANIMLHAAADGATQAKLLDFGVAKANAPDTTSAVERSQSDTAGDLTIAGFTVGTPYYMAPEQLDRNAADRRTDIFASGAVLFEMLTGRKAFAGTNRDEVLAAIRAGNVPLISKLRWRILFRTSGRYLASSGGWGGGNANYPGFDLVSSRILDRRQRRHLLRGTQVAAGQHPRPSSQVLRLRSCADDGSWNADGHYRGVGRRSDCIERPPHGGVFAAHLPVQRDHAGRALPLIEAAA
ncbi:MAG: serine/threonine-protein kinase [Vicinamibacterales bacterium]